MNKRLFYYLFAVLCTVTLFTSCSDDEGDDTPTVIPIEQEIAGDYKFVGLSHNTLRGAAGGAVLIAELLKAQGYITPKDAE